MAEVFYPGSYVIDRTIDFFSLAFELLEREISVFPIHPQPTEDSRWRWHWSEWKRQRSGSFLLQCRRGVLHCRGHIFPEHLSFFFFCNHLLCLFQFIADMDRFYKGCSTTHWSISLLRYYCNVEEVYSTVEVTYFLNIYPFFFCNHLLCLFQFIADMDRFYKGCSTTHWSISLLRYYCVSDMRWCNVYGRIVVSL